MLIYFIVNFLVDYLRTDWNPPITELKEWEELKRTLDAFTEVKGF